MLITHRTVICVSCGFAANIRLQADKTLPSRVEGAPSEAEEKAFWAKTIAGLKELHGADQIDELLL